MWFWFIYILALFQNFIGVGAYLKDLIGRNVMASSFKNQKNLTNYRASRVKGTDALIVFLLGICNVER